jgi:hypothetical protein
VSAWVKEELKAKAAGRKREDRNAAAHRPEKSRLTRNGKWRQNGAEKNRVKVLFRFVTGFSSEDEAGGAFFNGAFWNWEDF